MVPALNRRKKVLKQPVAAFILFRLSCVPFSTLSAEGSILWAINLYCVYIHTYRYYYVYIPLICTRVCNKDDIRVLLSGLPSPQSENMPVLGSKYAKLCLS